MGAHVTVIATQDAARGARGQRFRHQHVPGRRDRRHEERPRDSRSLRPATNDRRHNGRRRRLPGASHVPGPEGPDCRDERALPGCLAAELHQPDGNERVVAVRRRPQDQGGRAVPQRLSHGSGLSRLVGVPMEEVRYRAAGVNHQAWLLEWTHKGKDLYPVLRERIAADPGLSRRTRVEITVASASIQPRAASTRRSMSPGSFARRSKSIGTGCARSSTSGSARGTSRNSRSGTVPGAGCAARAPHECGRVRPPNHPLDRHRHRSRDHANVVNNGLIDNLPQGAAVEVPATVDASGLTPHPMGALPVQCAAMNRPYLSVAELTVEAARTGTPS